MKQIFLFILLSIGLGLSTNSWSQMPPTPFFPQPPTIGPIVFVPPVPTSGSQVPTITSFTPTSANVAATVTLTGTNFNNTAANNIVFFGATRATVTAATATSLTVAVPTGARYGAITVLNTATSLAAYSTQFFNPTFTPTKGSITASDMEAKVDFVTGGSPTSVAIGDLDGDGKPDLVVVNETPNTVSLYRNTSSSGSIAAGSFAAKVDFATGTNPNSVAIGDLDGDGKPDLAVGNFIAKTVSVFRNTSTPGSIAAGSFAAKVDFTTGLTPLSVIIGDLDGDGRPDLAVANRDSNTVSVFRNTSTLGSIAAGSFAAKVDFVTGGSPTSVAIGDLDGDGKPDLAVSNFGSSNVSVFRNTGSSGSIAAGSFAAKVDFATGIEPFSVAIGDLDGDGKPDLVGANSQSVSVLRNTSTLGSVGVGSFAAKVDFKTAFDRIFSVAIGDLDGDGKLDFAVANFSSKTVSLYRNTSSSGLINANSFTVKVDFATGVNPFSVAIGDLDGDGKPDLAVANLSSNTISVLRNNPVFPPPSPPTITSFTPTSANVAATVTLTGTNFNSTAANNIVFFGATRATVTAATASSLTVAVPTGARYGAITVLNTETSLAAYSTQFFNPTFTPTEGSITTSYIDARVDFETGTQPTSVVLGDLDGDGKPDLAVANFSSNTVSVYRNTGSSGSIATGSFAARVDFETGASPISVAIGDLDGDGKPDLVVTNNGSHNISLYRNIGSSGNITAGSFAARVDFASGTRPYSVAIGDLDGDGKSDLAVANYDSNTVSIFHNTSTIGNITAGSFAAKVDFTTGFNPISVAIGDLDGDGKPDLVVDNSNSASVSVYRNTSTLGSIVAGSFAAKVDFTTGGSPRSVAIGDLDGDGKLDLVVANYDSNNVSVLRNTSMLGSITAGSFATKVDFVTGINPRSVAIGDSDGDGKPDLAVANNSGTVSVFRNTSSSGSIAAGSFAAKVDFITGSESFSVAIGDLDGDGKPDLAVANFASGNVSVLRNTPVFKNNQTITFGAIDEKTYGDPTFTLGNAETNQGLAVSYTAEDPTVVSITGNQVTILKVGSAKITATQAGDELNSAAESVEQTLTVVRKALIINAADKQKTYGEANPALTFIYSGLVNGDTKVSTEPSIATTATASSNVGTYPITLNGGEDSNYTITLVNGDLEVTKAGVTITAADKQKTYGDANPTLTFTYSGLVNSDTKVTTEPVISTTATASSNAGTYPITLTGGSDANYTITLVNGILTVGKKDLILTAADKQKVFGTEDPAFTYTVSGLQAGDGTSILTGVLNRESGEGVGTYSILQGSLDAGANYTLVYLAGVLEIIPAKLATVINPALIQTPWSISPELPKKVNILTVDGQLVEIAVNWNSSPLNLLKRGVYTFFGVLDLPAGILNESDEKAVIRVEVLPKPAPQDVRLTNSMFDPSPTVFFQEVGAFIIQDPTDKIHVVSLQGAGYDNSYFEIKANILFWSSSDRAEGKTTFTIIVRVTDRDGNTLDKFFEIERKRTDINDIEVFSSFTPNGDRINDTWGVPDIRYYRGARIQVFDRSGQRLFYTENPDVRWDGMFEGKEMPVGSYIWILESGETGEIRRGVLSLLKK